MNTFPATLQPPTVVGGWGGFSWSDDKEWEQKNDRNWIESKNGFPKETKYKHTHTLCYFDKRVCGGAGCGGSLGGSQTH